MNTAYAQNAYTRTAVNTSSEPLDLIIMLYDGAIENLQRASRFSAHSETIAHSQLLSKTIGIIDELLASLNMDAGGEIADNLKELYNYMLRELTIAIGKNDLTRVGHVENLLKELRTAWVKIR